MGMDDRHGRRVAAWCRRILGRRVATTVVARKAPEARRSSDADLKLRPGCPRSADPGYPKPIAFGWKGLWPDGVDGAFVGSDGAAYFWKGGDSIRHDMVEDQAEAPQAIEDCFPGVRASLGILAPGDDVA